MEPMKAMMTLLGAWMFELMFFGWLIALTGSIGWVVPQAFVMLGTFFLISTGMRNAN